MYLKKNNLVIRNAAVEDAGVLCNWWNDGRVMEHAGFPNGIGTTVQLISDSLINDNDQSRRLIMEIDGIPVGEMNYRTIDEGVAEIGIKICDAGRQEKGFGTVFLRMLIQYLFEELGYQKIILDTNMKNTRAQHVYEKIGFQRIAVNVDSWTNQLGELQSSIDYELTREEYKKLP